MYLLLSFAFNFELRRYNQVLADVELRIADPPMNATAWAGLTHPTP